MAAEVVAAQAEDMTADPHQAHTTTAAMIIATIQGRILEWLSGRLLQ